MEKALVAMVGPFGEHCGDTRQHDLDALDVRDDLGYSLGDYSLSAFSDEQISVCAIANHGNLVGSVDTDVCDRVRR
jgi:hypothetical protein